MNRGQHSALQPHGSALRQMKRGVTVGQHIMFAHVTTRAHEFSISSFDEKEMRFDIRLHSPPEGGKANKELVNGLRKITGCDLRIAKGKTSRNKMLIFECPDETFENALRKIKEYVDERDRKGKGHN